MASVVAAVPSQALAPTVRLAAQTRDADAVAFGFYRSADGFEFDSDPAALSFDPEAVLGLHRATGAPGEIVTVPDGDRLVLLVGIGDGTPADLRRAAAALARATRGRAGLVTDLVAADPATRLEPVVTGLILASFSLTWSASPGPDPVGLVGLVGVASSWQPALDRAVAVVRASWRARWWATVPSNIKSPQWLADQASTLARDHDLAITVWDEDQLAAEGFGGLIAVGAGSANPPRLIRLDYRPSSRSSGKPARTISLVGKGITFDSGGYNIKPGASMATMKRDMTGGAVVMAVMAALAEVGCGDRVVGLIPTAENSVSGSAMRPGDVITHYGGRTTEVTNTDAEGRLVLADAMAYAVEVVKPDLIIDIATLTGAMKVALGQQVGGFFATSEELADQIEQASADSGEAVWRMPLAEVYEPTLHSSIADADNAGGGPGAITAALFLRHFTGGLDWAHLDVASVGDVPQDRDEWTKGPSGFGARLLLHLLAGPDSTQS